MSVLNLKITDAGRQALVDAENTGTLPLKLSVIALGSGRYTPTGTETALQAEIKPLNTFGAEVVAPDTIHVTITDESADTYTLGEFGLYTDTGVLFAIYSQTSPILEKAANAMMLLSVDVVLTSVTPGSVTIGDTDFILPPATETRQGLVELASNAEALAGTDLLRAMTPKRVQEWAAQFGISATDAAEVTDCNAVTKGGIYTLRSTAANTPPGFAGGTLFHMPRGNGGFSTQIAIDIYGVCSVRGQSKEQFGNWRKCWDDTNLKAATDTVAGLVKLATHEEVLDSTNGSQAVTPASLSSRLATQAEAEEGTNNIKFMTPMRVFQAIAKKVAQAKEDVLGIAKVATQEQTDTSTDDSTIVTPKKLRWGFSILLASNGYVVFPSWMGGLILQWGSGTWSNNQIVTFPIAFTSAVYSVQISDSIQISSGEVFSHATSDWTTTSFKFRTNISSGADLSTFFAVGK